METGHKTLSTDFILLGLFPGMRHTDLLVSVVLLIYIVAIIGNISLILLIWTDPHFHTCMYFLLSQFSLIDLIFISCIVPKMLVNFFLGKRSIPLIGCGAQIFFTLTLGIAVSLPDTHCLWPLCDYLSSSQILNHYQPLGPPADGCGVLGGRGSGILGPHGLCHALSPLWLLRALPLLLWSQSPHEAVLWGHICLWERTRSDQHCWGSSPHKPHSDFLYSHLLPGPANELPRWQEWGPGYCPPILLCSRFIMPQPCKYTWGLDLLTPLFWTRLSLFDTILTPMLNPLIYSLRNKEVVGSIRKMLRMYPISKQAPMSHWVDSSELKSPWRQ